MENEEYRKLSSQEIYFLTNKSLWETTPPPPLIATPAVHGPLILVSFPECWITVSEIGLPLLRPRTGYVTTKHTKTIRVYICTCVYICITTPRLLSVSLAWWIFDLFWSLIWTALHGRGGREGLKCERIHFRGGWVNSRSSMSLIYRSLVDWRGRGGGYSLFRRFISYTEREIENMKTMRTMLFITFMHSSRGKLY